MLLDFHIKPLVAEDDRGGHHSRSILERLRYGMMRPAAVLALR
jgi:hypothetical protein